MLFQCVQDNVRTEENTSGLSSSLTGGDDFPLLDTEADWNLCSPFSQPNYLAFEMHLLSAETVFYLWLGQLPCLSVL